MAALRLGICPGMSFSHISLSVNSSTLSEWCVKVEMLLGWKSASNGTATHSFTLMSQNVMAQRAQFRAQTAILLRLVIPASVRKIRNFSMLMAISAYMKASPS